jgi:hypothetical protein
MTLVAGTKLGPYEILAPIGAGGMGEVYTRLRLLRDLPFRHRAAARPVAEAFGAVRSLRDRRREFSRPGLRESWSRRELS